LTSSTEMGRYEKRKKETKKKKKKQKTIIQEETKIKENFAKLSTNRIVLLWSTYTEPRTKRGRLGTQP